MLRARRAGVSLRQNGWAGILLLLVVLGIGAIIAGASIKVYLAGGAPSAERTSTRAAAGGVGSVDAEVTAPTPSTGTALDRARGVGDIVQQRAAELQKRMDAQDQ